MEKFDNEYYSKKWILWDDMKVYGAAARHTRRIIIKFLKDLDFQNIIDISCGGGHLLAELKSEYNTEKLTGTEYAEKAIIEDKNRYPSIDFFQLDISKKYIDSKFDLVLCVDVLEHIEEDQESLANLRKMTGKYLVVAVPLGIVSKAERLSLGHVHGYTENEISGKIKKSGFKIIKSLVWGFPFYNLVRIFTKNMNSSPAEGKPSTMKKLLFKVLYYLYFFSIPINGNRYFALCAPQE